jgi:m7GpppX diphosphatase
LKWITDILEGTKESKDILFSDIDSKIGFVLLPDIKWDQINLSNLYLLAIVRSLDIKCLRDLTTEHLPLLDNILMQSKNIAKDKFGVDSHHLRFFIHYHPSYYHFHIHVVHVKMEPTKGMICVF